TIRCKNRGPLISASARRRQPTLLLALGAIRVAGRIRQIAYVALTRRGFSRLRLRRWIRRFGLGGRCHRHSGHTLFCTPPAPGPQTPASAPSRAPGPGLARRYFALTGPRAQPLGTKPLIRLMFRVPLSTARPLAFNTDAPRDGAGSSHRVERRA